MNLVFIHGTNRTRHNTGYTPVGQYGEDENLAPKTHYKFLAETTNIKEIYFNNWNRCWI